MAIFKGAGTAIVTPMNQDGSVNYEKLAQLIDFQIENGTDSIIICGTMGLGKTTILVDMLITQAIVFRQKALKVMQRYRFRFPNFPFPVLEAELKKVFKRKKKKLKNMPDIKGWVKSKKKKYKKNPCSENCFEFDFEQLVSYLEF